MKKCRYAKKFLESLSESGVVASACKFAGLSRNTVYRWCEEDPVFRREMEKAMDLGVALTNDLAISKEILAIQREEPWAIKHWLNNRHKNFIKPRPRSFWDEFSNNRPQGFEVIIRQGKNSPTSSRDKKDEDLNSS